VAALRRIIGLGILAIVSGTALAGCMTVNEFASAAFTYHSETTYPSGVQSIEAEKKSEKNYTIGQRSDANVGQVMIHERSYTVLPGFLAVKAFQNISMGSSWRCNYKTAEGDYVCENPDATADEVAAIIAPTGGLKGFSRSSLTPYASLPQGMESGIFIPREIPLPKPSLDRQLIYSGRQGSSISLSYRELVDGAPPSYYQALSYDLAESREITFKTLQIKVYDATNDSIAFAVMRD
jgi:hypothetical protein